MENVRLTKSGKPIWFSKEEKAKAILKAIESEGYCISENLTNEKLLSNKHYIARSATTITNRIEGVYRQYKQVEKFFDKWYQYDHLHDSEKYVSRDYLEIIALKNMLGDNVVINR